MSDTYLPLIKAVIARLKATSAVTSIVGQRIYTDVPQKETFPYIVITAESADYSAKDFSGMEHTLEIHGFSRSKTPLEAGNIRSESYDVINRNESGLTLDNGSMTNVYYQTGAIFKEPDGVTWHSLGQYRS